MSGKILGLDYQGLEAAARLAGLAIRPSDFSRIRLIENEVMRLNDAAR